MGAWEREFFLTEKSVHKSVCDGKKGLGPKDCGLGEKQGSKTVDFINNCKYIS